MQSRVRVKPAVLVAMATGTYCKVHGIVGAEHRCEVYSGPPSNPATVATAQRDGRPWGRPVEVGR